jgi:hypothetical protein
MPRARHHISFKLTFTERSPPMHACIIDGVVRPLYIKHGHGLSIDFGHHAGTWLHIIDSSHSRKIRHQLLHIMMRCTLSALSVGEWPLDFF